jgi:hypothetical protein
MQTLNDMTGDAGTAVSGPTQYDRFLAGFIIGKVVGLTLTFARWIFGLLVGGAAAAMVYHGTTSGLEALTAQVLNILQLLLSRRILAIGMATGFVSALIIGPALAQRSQPKPEITS